MELSRDADGYYQLVVADKLKPIEHWFRHEMDRVQSFAARGGGKNRAIVNVVLERWQRFVDARVEALIETYEQYDEIMEESDVDDFYHKLESARSSILSNCAHHGVSNAASAMADFDTTNRTARNKLNLAVKRFELNRKKKDEAGMYPDKISIPKRICFKVN